MPLTGESRPHKLLIVEDDPWLPVSIAETLEPLCEVRVARDGDEALRVVRDWGPHLVLCDVTIPGRDGVSVCRELKASPESCGVIVVLITGLASRETMVQGWEAGADDYILKPFYPQELVARVRGLLAAAQVRRQAAELEGLRAKERFQRDFVANISHELRTPIAAIRGFAETLRRGAGARERRVFALRIERQAERLSHIVDDLLTLASLEALPDGGWSDDICLSDFIADFVGRQPAAAGQPVVRLEVEPRLTVRGDRDQLRRVLENLVANAVRVSPKGAAVSIGVSRAGSEAVLRVADLGPSIPAEHLDRVFDHFFRPGSRRRRADSGLGLSIVRRVVAAHGGRVWARSSAPRGSTLCVALPLAETAPAPGQKAGVP